MELVSLALVVGGLIVAVPIIALISAATAHSKIKRLRHDVLTLESQVAVLRRSRRDEVASAPATLPVVEPKAAVAPEEAQEPEELDEPLEPDPAEQAPEASTTPPGIEPPVTPDPVPPPRAKKTAEHLGAWIFAAAGGLGLLVGGLLFFSYALDQGWLAFFGPGARFATGVLAGVAALLGSERLVKKGLNVPAAALGGGGLGILYGALYAGHSLYELFPNLAAFALMSGVTVVSVLLAWRRDSQFLAALGLVGGLLTPILLSTGDNRALALFAYLAVLNAGVMTTSVLRKWPAMVGFAGLGTLVIQIGWAAEYGAADQLPFGLGAAAVFAALSAAVCLHPRTELLTARVASGVLAVQSLAVLVLLVPHDLVVWQGVEVQAVLQDPGAVAWLIPLFFAALAATLRVVAQKRDWPIFSGLALGGLGVAAMVFGFGWESELDALEKPTHHLHVLVTAGVLAPLTGWWLAGLGRAWSREWILPILLLGTGLLVGGVGLEADGPPVLVGVTVAALALIGTLESARNRGLTAIAGLLGAAAAVYGPIAAMADDERTWLVAPAVLVAVALVTAWPFLRRDTERTWPWLASALAGPVLYYPLQLAWAEQLGSSAIGLLPVVLGAFSLAAAVKVKAILGNDQTRLAAYVIAATLFACIAVPVQLEGQWVVLGWAAEAAVLAWLSRRLAHPGVKVFALVLISLACGRLLMDPQVEQLTLTYVGLGASLLSMAWLLDREPEFLAVPVTRILRFVAVFVFFVQLNLEVDRFFEAARFTDWGSLAPEMTRSLLWAAYGALLLTIGVRIESKYTRLLAMSILMLAAGKVFFVDLWDLAGMWRVGSVLGAAVTLIGCAVLLQKLVLREKEVAA